MKPKKGKDPLVKSFSAAIAGKLTQIYMFFHTLNPKEIVMKKIVNAFLIAATCLSLCVPAMAIETNSVTTDDCVIISQEEYYKIMQITTGLPMKRLS